MTSTSRGSCGAGEKNYRVSEDKSLIMSMRNLVSRRRIGWLLGLDRPEFESWILSHAGWLGASHFIAESFSSCVRREGGQPPGSKVPMSLHLV